MSSPVQTIPDRMMQLASQYADHWIAVKKPPAEIVEKVRAEMIRDFCRGFDAGVEAVRGGELLAENHQLHGMFIDLSIGQQRIVALEGLLSVLTIETAAHEEACCCVACRAIDKFCGRINGLNG